MLASAADLLLQMPRLWLRAVTASRAGTMHGRSDGSVAPAAILRSDLRLGVRALARRPTFTVIAISTLAIGIGTNTAIWSVAYELLVRPLNLPQSERLVAVWGTSVDRGQMRDVVSGPNFLDFQRDNRTFEAMAAYKDDDRTVLVDGRPIPKSGLLVSAGFFEVLGVEPYLGRTFVPEDGRGEAVILSHAFWRLLGARESIIGSTLTGADRAYTVLGVLRPEFADAFAADMYFALDRGTLREAGRTSINYWIVGRLKSGVSVAQAEQDLDSLLAEIAREDSRLQHWSMTVEPLAHSLYESIRRPVVLLLIAVAIAFLISCANVANLVLAQSLPRSRELAIRASLGADRRRIVRQLLTEGGILAVGGAALGVVLAIGLVRLLPSLLPSEVAVPGSAAIVQLPRIEVDERVVLFAALLAGLSVVCFALGPALRATGSDLVSAMREVGAAVSTGAAPARAQRAVVLVEVGLATVLLVTTGTALRGTLRLLEVDSGLQVERVLSMYVGELDRWKDADRARYHERVLAAVSVVPGVSRAGLNDYVPFRQEDDFTGFHLEGRPPSETATRVEWRRISHGYLETVGLPLREGRTFTAAEGRAPLSVAIVNRALADQVWPGESPVGQRIVIHNGAYGPTEIVGVVGDVRRRGLDRAAPPVLYVPYQRQPRPIMALFAKTDGDPAAVMPLIRDAIWSVDERQPIQEISTLAEVLSGSTYLARLLVWLIAAVASVAVALTAVGLYGLMSCWVRRRLRDLGIRLALGADSRLLSRSVVRSGLVLAMVGLSPGLVAGMGLSRLLARTLYGVEVLDPVPYLGSALLVIVVAILSSLLPARAVAMADPIAVLRTG